MYYLTVALAVALLLACICKAPVATVIVLFGLATALGMSLLPLWIALLSALAAVVLLVKRSRTWHDAPEIEVVRPPAADAWSLFPPPLQPERPPQLGP